VTQAGARRQDVSSAQVTGLAGEDAHSTGLQSPETRPARVAVLDLPVADDLDLRVVQEEAPQDLNHCLPHLIRELGPVMSLVPRRHSLGWAYSSVRPEYQGLRSPQ